MGEFITPGVRVNALRCLSWTEVLVVFALFCEIAFFESVVSTTSPHCLLAFFMPRKSGDHLTEQRPSGLHGCAIVW